MHIVNWHMQDILGYKQAIVTSQLEKEEHEKLLKSLQRSLAQTRQLANTCHGNNDVHEMHQQLQRQLDQARYYLTSK